MFIHSNNSIQRFYVSVYIKAEYQMYEQTRRNYTFRQDIQYVSIYMYVQGKETGGRGRVQSKRLGTSNYDKNN